MGELKDIRPVLPYDTRQEVLMKVAPDERERERVLRTAVNLVAAINDAIVVMGLDGVEPMLAGSVAKGTFSKGPDIDVFLLFPASTSRSELERTGLAIGAKVLEDPMKRFTQHPYLTGLFEGMTCDVVPCIKVARGEKVHSPVDRSVHHVGHINATLLPELRDDVLLLKSFLKGIGSYGAEDTVNGFSGYLVELFIIAFSGFTGAIRSLAGIGKTFDPPTSSEEVGDITWVRDGPVVMDIGEGELSRETVTVKEMGARFPREPLIVIDPVDPRRNVASPVSAQTLAHTSGCSRRLLECPAKELFHPFSSRPMRFSQRKDRPLDASRSGGIFLTGLPDGNSSIVATQLRRTLRTCASSLKREGLDKVAVRFCLVHPKGRTMDQGYARTRWALVSDHVTGPTLAFKLMTEPQELPPLRHHWGPPSDNPRATEFKARWEGKVLKDPLSGRLFTMVSRGSTDPVDHFLAAWSRNARGLFFGSELIPGKGGVIDRLADDVLSI